MYKKSVRKKKRNPTTREESWESFVSGSEHDIHGRQSVIYKAMEYINKLDVQIYMYA
jgi:hypothetical protein